MQSLKKFDLAPERGELMFCPKCAAQNIPDAKFCRVCGADISLVPMALTGALQQTQQANSLTPIEDQSAQRTDGRRQRAATPDQAIKKMFMGMAFLLISVMIAVSTRDGGNWWFWMLIPAFALLGDGIGTFVRYKHEQRRQLDAQAHRTHNAPNVATLNSSSVGSLNPAPHRQSFVSDIYSAQKTGEIVQPPSVTEGTTRLLEITPTDDTDKATSLSSFDASKDDGRTDRAP